MTFAHNWTSQKKTDKFRRSRTVGKVAVDEMSIRRNDVSPALTPTSMLTRQIGLTLGVESDSCGAITFRRLAIWSNVMAAMVTMRVLGAKLAIDMSASLIRRRGRQ